MEFQFLAHLARASLIDDLNALVDVHYSATIFVEDQRLLLCGYSTYR
ncbi:hypothetical protein T06_7858 [Trichinella sp. T6]|nr:hypothetical protein T06_7858 [Trichinella sp. T6]